MLILCVILLNVELFLYFVSFFLFNQQNETESRNWNLQLYTSFEYQNVRYYF
jgi:hypothetical protein